ncbi:hypothetical protein N0V90_006948 [Kalmusia sp. IMI 367209]|nr:hypothetical protein N0V90_006948 [Kalmusia sp. IMI 367209]
MSTPNSTAPVTMITGAPLNFNKDYYLNTHIPRFAEISKPYGYLGWHFNEFLNPNPVTSQPPEYLYQTVGYFDALENLFKLLQEMKRLGQEDMPNFVEDGVQPVISIGTKVKEVSFAK